MAHKGVRPLYLGLGILCVGLGYAGYIVPGMPGTVFMLIALWAFKKSSPKFENWLLNESPMGPTLRDWQENKSLSLKTKIIAIAMIWLSIFVSIALIHRVWAQVLLGVTAVALTVFLSTRKTKPA